MSEGLGGDRVELCCCWLISHCRGAVLFASVLMLCLWKPRARVSDDLPDLLAREFDLEGGHLSAKLLPEWHEHHAKAKKYGGRDAQVKFAARACPSTSEGDRLGTLISNTSCDAGRRGRDVPRSSRVM